MDVQSETLIPCHYCVAGYKKKFTNGNATNAGSVQIMELNAQVKHYSVTHEK